MTFSDSAGTEVARLAIAGRAGVNRVVWNLAHSEPKQDAARPPAGPLVVPGRYAVKVQSNGSSATGSIEVREDPRLSVPAGVRAAWTATLLELSALRRDAQALATRAAAAARAGDNARQAELAEVRRQVTELVNRTGRLYGEARDAVQPLTAQQVSQRAYYREMIDTLSRELTRLGAS